jgi:hypothetical protein
MFVDLKIFAKNYCFPQAVLDPSPMLDPHTTRIPTPPATPGPRPPPDPCPTWIFTSWAMPDPCTTGIPTPWSPHPPGPPGPKICVWDDQSHTLLGSPPHWDPRPSRQAPAWCETAAFSSLLGSLPFRQSQAPALQAFRITTPQGSHSGHHQRTLNLPKRQTETGLHVKGITSEKLRLQFYCSRTGDFFSPFFKGLAAWFAVWTPTNSPIFSLFSLPFIFPSLSLFYPSLLVLLVLILLPS